MNLNTMIYPCLGSRQGQQRDLLLNSTQSKTIYSTNSNNLVDTQVRFLLQHSSVSLVKRKLLKTIQVYQGKHIVFVDSL
jgi:hypothetical protein